MKIIVLDYGVGNLKSVLNALQFLGYPATLSTDAKDISDADLVVMPGQGAFGEAMTNLEKQGLVEPVKQHIASQKSFLGICVGFQVLFEGSEEKGAHQGLGIFPGTFKIFSANSELKVPQMGWNRLVAQNDFDLVADIENPFVYFVHSYYLPITQTPPALIAATAEYGVPFVAAIQTPTLLATQFHPEKSGDVGMTLLKRFLERQEKSCSKKSL